MMKRVSVQDVARDAGVSLGTVSNVFNNPDRVRPETRAKVEHSVAKLGFVRNEQARALKAGTSTTVAYVMLNASNPFFTDLAAGMDSVLRAEGLTLFLCDSREDPQREDNYLEQLLQRRVKGLFVTGVNYENERLMTLQRAGVPVVIVDRPPSEHNGQWCTVAVDDREGGELAIAHLLDQGHRRIAFAGGPETMPQVRHRLEGARRAMRDADGGELVLMPTEHLTIDDGMGLGSRLVGMARTRRPTAIFCANDLLAIGLLQSAVAHGLHVPDDLAIVGYDDIVYAGAAAVPITSVAQPARQMGRAAAELLLAEANDAASATTPGTHVHRDVVFRPTLVARASSVGH